MNVPNTAVILAAGDGGRIADLIDYPKVLIEHKGKTILENQLEGLSKYGVKKFILVVGWKMQLIESYVKTKSLDAIFDISYVKNFEYHTRENGYSAFLGLKEAGKSDSFLVMGDHVFDYSFLEKYKLMVSDDEPMVDFIDKSMKSMKPEWCTKIVEDYGYVVKSNKKLIEFNALDIGLFILKTPIVIKGMDLLIKQNKSEWNDTVEYYIKEKMVRSYDIGGNFWHGVNNPEQYQELMNK